MILCHSWLRVECRNPSVSHCRWTGCWSSGAIVTPKSVSRKIHRFFLPQGNKVFETKADFWKYLWKEPYAYAKAMNAELEMSTAKPRSKMRKIFLSHGKFCKATFEKEQKSSSAIKNFAKPRSKKSRNLSQPSKISQSHVRKWEKSSSAIENFAKPRSKMRKKSSLAIKNFAKPRSKMRKIFLSHQNFAKPRSKMRKKSAHEPFYNCPMIKIYTISVI